VNKCVILSTVSPAGLDALLLSLLYPHCGRSYTQIIQKCWRVRAHNYSAARLRWWLWGGCAHEPLRWWCPVVVLSWLNCFAAQGFCEVLNVIINLWLNPHYFFDFVNGVHDGGVVFTAEGFANLWEG